MKPEIKRPHDPMAFGEVRSYVDIATGKVVEEHERQLSQRDAFEAFIRTKPYMLPGDGQLWRDTCTGKYTGAGIETYWMIWQAAATS